jgi:hypothetical protein
MSIEIKRIDGTVAYESQSATSLKEAAEEAVRQGVSLARAHFPGANFSGAHFSGADFSLANFSGANFSGANFSGANFSRANFYGANFSGAEGILHVGPVDGWDMYAVRWDDGPRIKAGCRWFTVSEARKWWGKGGAPGNKPEHGPLMLAGLEALLALAKAHGWEMPCGWEMAAGEGS